MNPNTKPLTDEEKLIEAGIQNPLPEERLINIIARSIIKMRESALKRNDQEVLKNLEEGDPYEIARKIVRRGRK